MSINAEWTNADALGFRPYTAYGSASVTYSTTTTDPTSNLLTENAKLRELVRELYHELDAATQHDVGGGRGIVSEFADRMRELGVE